MEKQLTIKDILYEKPGPRGRVVTVAATVVSGILILALVASVVWRFYKSGQLDSKYWDFFAKYTTWRFLGKGLLGTIEAALMSAVVALAAGFLLMYMRIGRLRFFKGLSIGIIEFTRGVPTLLFIYFFFLAAPQMGIKLNSFWRIVLPVAISACGVVAELLRGGVNAVPKGQSEAAFSLGLGDFKTLVGIVFPQAFRYVIPALISELVIVVKDTTFAYIINFSDLMQNAKVLISNHDAMLSVYLVVSIIYIIINFLLNKAADLVAGRTRRK